MKKVDKKFILSELQNSKLVKTAVVKNSRERRKYKSTRTLYLTHFCVSHLFNKTRHMTATNYNTSLIWRENRAYLKSTLSDETRQMTAIIFDFSCKQLREYSRRKMGRWHTIGLTVTQRASFTNTHPTFNLTLT